MKFVQRIFIGFIFLDSFALVIASIDTIYKLTAINDPSSVNLAETALHILKYNSPTNTIIVRSDSSPVFSYFVQSLRKIYATVIVINSWEFLQPIKTPIAICNFIQDASTVQRIDLQNIHPQSHLLLTLTEPTAEEKMSTIIRNIGKLVRDHRLYNVVILYNSMNENGTPSLRAGRYDLFCDFPDAFENITNALASGEVFHAAVRSLCGYRLRLSIKNSSFSQNLMSGKGEIGFDGHALNVLLKMTNATADIVMFDNAASQSGKENDTEVIKRAILQTDIWMISWYSLPDLSEYMDQSYPHEKDDTCIMVPKSEQMPQYFNILSTFKGSALALVIASIVASGGAMHLVNRWESHIRREPRWDAWYSFRVVHMFLNSGVILPKMPADRLVNVGVMLFAYLLLVIVQCSLTSNLMVTRFYPDIETISELMESGYQIVVDDEGYHNLYTKMDPDLFEQLARILRIEDMDFILKSLYANEQFGLALFRSQGEQLVRMSSHTVNDRPVYHVMNECPVPGDLMYFVTPDSPLIHSVNHVTRSIIESGFSLVWSPTTLDIELNVTRVPPDTSEETVISSQNLVSAFIVYTLGIGLSMCVFIGEMRDALATFFWRFL